MQYKLGLGNKFWVGEFSGKALAAAGTTCPENLPFKIPQSGTGCPSARQLEQGIDIWELTVSIQ